MLRTYDMTKFGVQAEPEHKYNPDVDVCPVVPEQAVNIARALTSGRIPANLAPEDLASNGIENPADIISVKVDDNFAAMRAETAVRDAGTKLPADTPPSAAPAAAPVTSQE